MAVAATISTPDSGSRFRINISDCQLQCAPRKKQPTPIKVKRAQLGITRPSSGPLQHIHHQPNQFLDPQIIAQIGPGPWSHTGNVCVVACVHYVSVRVRRFLGTHLHSTSHFSRGCAPLTTSASHPSPRVSPPTNTHTYTNHEYGSAIVLGSSHQQHPPDNQFYFRSTLISASLLISLHLAP